MVKAVGNVTPSCVRYPAEGTSKVLGHVGDHLVTPPVQTIVRPSSMPFADLEDFFPLGLTP